MNRMRLTISNLDKDDIGNYSCSLNNGVDPELTWDFFVDVDIKGE